MCVCAVPLSLAVPQPSLSRGISAGEGELLEALQHATGLPSGLQRSVSNTAQLMQSKQFSHLTGLTGDTAAQARALHRGSLGATQLDQLLDQAGIPRGGSLAAAAAVDGSSQQQQQLSAAGVHPGALGASSMPPSSQLPPNVSKHLQLDKPRVSASAAADSQETMSLLMQLLPSLAAEKAAVIAAQYQQPLAPSNAGLRHSTSNAQAEALAAARAAAAAGPYSPPGPTAMQEDMQDGIALPAGLARSKSNATAAAAAAAAAAHPGAVPPGSHQLVDHGHLSGPMGVDGPTAGIRTQQGKRSLKDVLLLATTTAAKNPSAASALLLEALQQQLDTQPPSCRQNAAAAAAAVASAGDTLHNSMGSHSRSKQPSAAAAFAAIAAAAAAAAATAAGLEEEQQQQEDADSMQQQQQQQQLPQQQLPPAMRPPRGASSAAGVGTATLSSMLAATATGAAGSFGGPGDSEAIQALLGSALGLVGGSGRAAGGGAAAASGLDVSQLLPRLMSMQQQQQHQVQQQQQQPQQQQLGMQLLASLLEAAQMKHNR